MKVRFRIEWSGFSDIIQFVKNNDRYVTYKSSISIAELLESSARYPVNRKRFLERYEKWAEK